MSPQFDSQVATDILRAFSPDDGTTIHENKLPEGDPLKNLISPMSDRFTSGVGFLKTVFPNQAIRELMTLVWDLVGNRITPVAMGPQVQSLSIACTRRLGMTQAIIFMPHHWLAMIKADPIYQLGALVYVGSQAVDFYNGKLYESPQESENRARAHEAEFLLTHIVIATSTPPMNDYQKGVLEEYPLGINTPAIRHLLYTSKPFVAPA
jgi:hypothetical protein